MHSTTERCQSRHDVRAHDRVPDLDAGALLQQPAPQRKPVQHFLRSLWNLPVVERQGDIKFDIEWTTLGEYLQFLEDKGVSTNVASFVGATTVRIHELGHEDRPPTEGELERMQALVRAAMEEGALIPAAQELPEAELEVQGTVSNPADGVAMAATAIDDGSAGRFLDRLRQHFEAA